MAAQTWLATEEFLAREWPPGSELVDGEVVVNDPTFGHQRLVVRLLEALRAWTRLGELRGEAGVGGNWTLAPGQVYKPDVWWVREEARPPSDAVRSDLPPTLVAEVRSPGTWHIDLGRKREIYETAGVAELWLVDTPARTVLVYRRSRSGAPGFDDTAEVGPGEVLASPLLEGFALPVDELFAV